MTMLICHDGGQIQKALKPVLRVTGVLVFGKGA